MQLTIAHSPDSDDAYMMAPLALGWLDPEGFEIAFVRKDIEQLNAEATESRYDVTAISFGAEKPKATGHDEDAWKQNRRDDVNAQKDGAPAK